MVPLLVSVPPLMFNVTGPPARMLLLLVRLPPLTVAVKAPVELSDPLLDIEPPLVELKVRLLSVDRATPAPMLKALEPVLVVAKETGPPFMNNVLVPDGD